MGPSLIVELGTHYGTSSLAFAENKESVILTYDIVDRYKIKKRHQPNNVIRKVKNIFEEKQEVFLLKADLIFMDTYHDGIFEKQVYDFHYICLHDSPYYHNKHDGREMPNAKSYEKCLVRLPILFGLSESDIKRVTQKVLEFYED